MTDKEWNEAHPECKPITGATNYIGDSFRMTIDKEKYGFSIVDESEKSFDIVIGRKV